ncbi:snoRNA-binding protein [Rhizina undulata]
MAKDRSEKKEKKDKDSKEKKAKKVVDLAVMGDSKVTKSKDDKKKEKKDKEKKRADATTLLDAMEGKDEEKLESVNVEVKPTSSDLLVPFARPLAEDKTSKKVLKTVKKAAKNKCLKRGVKEVVKALRKSPSGNAAAAATGIVVLAADISPMDVISHIPVLCEDHNIPYIFVTSRAELGAAGATKRPTSVVMIVPGLGKKDKKKKKKSKDGEDKMNVDEENDEGDDGFREAYDEAVKLVEAAGKNVPV